jgi:hypothetical protein
LVMPQRWPEPPPEPLNSPPAVYQLGQCLPPTRKHRLVLVDQWLVCERCGLVPAKKARYRRGMSRRRLIATWGPQCFYCGILFDRPEAEFTVDHWWPRGLGGSDKANNLRPACADCNQRKDSMRPRRFMRSEWLRMRREWVRLVYGDVPPVGRLDD